MDTNGSFYPQILKYWNSNLPFVLFRLPGQTINCWVQHTSSLCILKDPNTLPSTTGFLFAPFLPSEETPILFLQPDLIFEENEFIDTAFAFTTNHPKSTAGSEPVKETDKSTYLSNLDNLISLLQTGEAEKVVISRTIVAERRSDEQILKAYSLLCHHHPNAFVYFAHFPTYGTWMGATPETLLSCHANRCQTMALAGTRTAGSGVEWGVKEKKEQAIVSCYIKDVLQRYEIQNLSMSEPFTSSSGIVEHLCTIFTFDLTLLSDVGSLTFNLHPTPAVCGAPLDKAMKLIARFESQSREYYTGFMGPVNCNRQTQLFVNLRCMKITSTQMVLFTGGGITCDSVTENEWEETSMKAHTLLSVIEKIRNLAV